MDVLVLISTKKNYQKVQNIKNSSRQDNIIGKEAV